MEYYLVVYITVQSEVDRSTFPSLSLPLYAEAGKIRTYKL